MFNIRITPTPVRNTLFMCDPPSRQSLYHDIVECDRLVFHIEGNEALGVGGIGGTDDQYPIVIHLNRGPTKTHPHPVERCRVKGHAPSPPQLRQPRTVDIPRRRPPQPYLPIGRIEPHRIPCPGLWVHPSAQPARIVAERAQADVRFQCVIAPPGITAVALGVAAAVKAIGATDHTPTPAQPQWRDAPAVRHPVTEVVLQQHIAWHHIVEASRQGGSAGSGGHHHVGPASEPGGGNGAEAGGTVEHHTGGTDAPDGHRAPGREPTATQHHGRATRNRAAPWGDPAQGRRRRWGNDYYLGSCANPSVRNRDCRSPVS